MRLRSLCTAVISVLAASSAFAAPPQLAGFPRHAEGKNESSGILLVDLDLDEKLEVVVASADGVAVIRHDGALFPGFPIGLKAEGQKTRLLIDSAPAACDLNGDGRPEIVLASSNELVWAVSASGELLRGFPVAIDGRPRGPLACVGDAKKSLVLTTDAGELIRITGGKVSRVARIGRGAESGVGVADVDGDGLLDFAVGGGDSKLYLVNEKGKVRDGFPYKMSFRVSGIPAIGDIDDDGRVEVVFGSQDFKIHALNLDGELLPGFPVATGYRVYAGVALADLTGDGVLEVVVGSGDSKLYALTGAGKAVPGFPVKLDGRVIADAAIGDVDRDGTPEIAVVTQGGSLYLLTARGKKVAGFPYRLGGKVEIAPAMGDLDGDGDLELVGQAQVGQVSAFTFKARGKAEEGKVAWGMVGHDAAHSGRYGPNPGRFKALGFATPAPFTTDALAVTYTFFDLDGEAERGTQIRWYLNGKRQAALDNQRRVLPAGTQKHQRWAYSVQGGDNFTRYGESGALTRIQRSPEVTIANTPPAAPGIDLSPKAPFTDQDLVVKVTAPSVDPDGDEVAYRFAWIRDRQVQSLAKTTKVIRGKQTRKKQQWRVVVVPYDGEVEGANATALVSIENTLPTAPKIAAQPGTPSVEDEVTIAIVEPALDEDGDTVTYAYRYWVDGVRLNLPKSSSRIPAGVLRKHQKVRVEVTAVDDQAPGGKVETQFEVRNTPPPPPVVATWPATPRTDDGLTFSFARQPADPDGDAISYRHLWRVDEAPKNLPVAVTPDQTRKGQTWRVEVIPTDGENDGVAATTQTVIRNSPPDPPLALLDDLTPATDEPVQPRIALAARDADGDAVTLKYQWARNGKRAKLPPGQAALTAANTRTGERWSVSITPHDGEADGAATNLGFVVRNSPPTAPGVTVARQEVTTREKVAVSIATAATDVDGDRLSYRYRWRRDGVAEETWPASKSALEAGEGKRGERWAVEVRAFDGELEGPPGSVSFRITNHPPAAPRVTVSPAQPTTTQPLNCKPQGATDPDGDRVAYRVRWWVDERPLNLDTEGSAVPPALTRRGQRWICEAEAFDGELASKGVRSSPLVIRNSRPTAPQVVITPAQPTVEDELRCELARLSGDADQDRIAYQFAWKVGGRAQRVSGDAPHRVAAGVAKRGQSWTCEVTPKDDEGAGAAAKAAVTIANAPPAAPEVRIKQRRPKAGEALDCELAAAAEDADGDRVQYRFQWLRDGKLQRATGKGLAEGTTKADEIWRCKVTPTDGKNDGAPGWSPDVVVRAP